MILARQAGIVGEEIVFRPSLAEQPDDEIDGEPRPAHDRLSGQHVRVDEDSLSPRHAGQHIGPSTPLPLRSAAWSTARAPPVSHVPRSLSAPHSATLAQARQVSHCPPYTGRVSETDPGD